MSWIKRVLQLVTTLAHPGYRKYAVGAFGAVAQVALIAQPYLTGTAAHYAQVIVAVATALGIRQASNAPSLDGTVPAYEEPELEEDTPALPAG